MYLDKLDGNITSSFYEQKTNEWRAQQDRLRQTINELRLTTLDPLDQAVNLLDMTSLACHRFTNQPPEEQRRRLTTWKEGELSVTLLEPFKTLQHSNSVTATNNIGTAPPGRDIGIWLPTLDVFRTLAA